MIRELKERNKDGRGEIKGRWYCGWIASKQVALTTLTLCTTQLFLILGVMALNEDPGAAGGLSSTTQG